MIWSALFGLAAGAAITWACAPRVIEMLLQTVGPRANYRKRATAFPAGLALILGSAGGSVVALIIGAAGKADHGAHDWADHAAVLILTFGFGLAGFVDDLLGGHDHSGFGGHLGAMRRGIVTTGAFKIATGAILSLAAVAVIMAGTWGPVERVGPPALPLALAQLAVDSALVAVSANLVNLLDRRPGRAIKGFLLGAAAASVVIWLSRGGDELARAAMPSGSVIGAAIALIRLDLGEQVMLGDTGSNPLGAVLGLMLLHLAPGWRTALLALMAWLTLTSERVSFTSVIDANPVLRFLDRLGRRDT